MADITEQSKQIDAFLTSFEDQCKKTGEALIAFRNKLESNIETESKDTKDDGTDYFNVYFGSEDKALDWTASLISTDTSTSTSATADDLSALPAVFGNPAEVLNNTMMKNFENSHFLLGQMLETMLSMRALQAQMLSAMSKSSSPQVKAAAEKAVAATPKAAAQPGFGGHLILTDATFTNLAGVDVEAMKKSMQQFNKLEWLIFKNAAKPFPTKLIEVYQRKVSSIVGIINSISSISGKKFNELDDGTVTIIKNSLNRIDSLSNAVLNMKFNYVDAVRAAAKAKAVNALIQPVIALISSVEVFNKKAASVTSQNNITVEQIVEAMLKPFNTFKSFSEKSNELVGGVKAARKNLGALVGTLLAFGAVMMLSAVVGLITIIALPGLLAMSAATYLLLGVGKGLNKLGKLKKGELMKGVGIAALIGLGIAVIGGVMIGLAFAEEKVHFATNAPKLMGGLIISLLTFGIMGLAFAGLGAIAPVAMPLIVPGIALVALIGLGIVAIAGTMAIVAKLKGPIEQTPALMSKFALAIIAMSKAALVMTALIPTFLLASLGLLPAQAFIWQMIGVALSLQLFSKIAGNGVQGVDNFTKAIKGLKKASDEMSGIDFNASKLDEISVALNKFTSDLKLGGMIRATLAMKAMATSMSQLSQSTAKMQPPRLEVPTASTAPTAAIAQTTQNQAGQPAVAQPVQKVMEDSSSAATARSVNNIESASVAKTAKEKEGDDTISYKSDLQTIITALKSLATAINNSASSGAAVKGSNA